MAMSYVTWEISSSCNMDCGFCFSDWRENPNQLSTSKAREVIDFLCSHDVDALSFTGGEPLLRPDLGELVKYAKRKGLVTILTTNGILLKERLPEFAQYLDFVALPLDSSEEAVHNSMRNMPGASHYSHVLGLVDMINEGYKGIGVKINTLVSKKNISSVAGLGRLLEGKVVGWKLSHFIPYGFGEGHREEYELPEGQFSKLAEACRKDYPHLNIIAPQPHSLDDACRVISSEGHLFRATQDGLKDLGKLLELSEQQILEGFNEKLNLKHLKITYLGEPRC